MEYSPERLANVTTHPNRQGSYVSPQTHKSPRPGRNQTSPRQSSHCYILRTNGPSRTTQSKTAGVVGNLSLKRDTSRSPIELAPTTRIMHFARAFGRGTGTKNTFSSNDSNIQPLFKEVTLLSRKNDKNIPLIHDTSKEIMLKNERCFFFQTVRTCH